MEGELGGMSQNVGDKRVVLELTMRPFGLKTIQKTIYPNGPPSPSCNFATLNPPDLYWVAVDDC